ncbi:hypothetical protein EDB19DRAFT_1830007 [Suillus lakei]|nr:hypothetical protein EDB19DRAFT_1830007 [Suillus lakei]
MPLEVLKWGVRTTRHALSLWNACVQRLGCKVCVQRQSIKVRNEENKACLEEFAECMCPRRQGIEVRNEENEACLKEFAECLHPFLLLNSEVFVSNFASLSLENNTSLSIYKIIRVVKTVLKGGDVRRAWLELVRCAPYLRRRSDTSPVYRVESAKSEAMYEAYGKLINEMHNRKPESEENLYGDIQKEKENGDEMEMSDGDGIGGRGSGTRNMTRGGYAVVQPCKLNGEGKLSVVPEERVKLDIDE